MGRGDKKTRKGKIAMGSYGVLRPKKTSSETATEKKKKRPVKAKSGTDEGEVKTAEKKTTKPKKS